MSDSTEPEPESSSDAAQEDMPADIASEDMPTDAPSEDMPTDVAPENMPTDAASEDAPVEAPGGADALSSLSNQSTRQANSIDALAALAAARKAAPADNGGEFNVPVPPASVADLAAAAPSRQAPPVELGGLAGVGGANKEQALQMRRKRAVALQGQTRHAHAQQFKSFMIPMLIVTGALLFVLATVVALLRPSDAGTFNPEYSSWYENPTTKKALVLIAYPLGAILFLGAWLFYVDLQRHKKS